VGLSTGDAPPSESRACSVSPGAVEPCEAPSPRGAVAAQTTRCTRRAAPRHALPPSARSALERGATLRGARTEGQTPAHGARISHTRNMRIPPPPLSDRCSQTSGHPSCHSKSVRQTTHDTRCRSSAGRRVASRTAQRSATCGTASALCAAVLLRVVVPRRLTPPGRSDVQQHASQPASPRRPRAVPSA